jgi:hypothetical protein
MQFTTLGIARKEQLERVVLMYSVRSEPSRRLLYSAQAQSALAPPTT